MLDHATLLSLAHYDPETGHWTSIQRTRGRKANVRIDCHLASGYLQVQFKKRRYPAARLAWFYMTGSWPTHDIDHKNHQPLDNRWVNLRQATRSQNMGNARKRSDNTSGFRRVSWDKERSKWVVFSQIHGKAKYIGRFSNKLDAIAAARKATKNTFKEFACYD